MYVPKQPALIASPACVAIAHSPSVRVPRRIMSAASGANEGDAMQPTPEGVALVASPEESPPTHSPPTQPTTPPTADVYVCPGAAPTTTATADIYMGSVPEGAPITPTRVPEGAGSGAASSSYSPAPEGAGKAKAPRRGRWTNLRQADIDHNLGVSATFSDVMPHIPRTPGQGVPEGAPDPTLVLRCAGLGVTKARASLLSVLILRVESYCSPLHCKRCYENAI